MSAVRVRPAGRPDGGRDDPRSPQRRLVVVDGAYVPPPSGAAPRSLLDSVLAILLIVVTAPVMIAAAIAVKLDGGPVFSRRRSVDRSGRETTRLTFRSESPEPVTRATAGPDTEERIGLRPSVVTAVGGVLRASSIDELPCLFDAARGSALLVGHGAASSRRRGRRTSSEQHAPHQPRLISV